jgi:hypothetical protein
MKSIVDWLMCAITCIQCYGVGKIEIDGKVVDCPGCGGTGKI